MSKTKEELNALKEEVEAVNEKLPPDTSDLQIPWHPLRSAGAFFSLS